MLAAYPKFAVRRGRGWSLFLLASLMAIWISFPAAVPAAVPEPSVRPPPGTPDPPPVPPLWMPVAGAVVRGFDTRAGPFGPGHRGIDIAASVGELVRSPTAGRVVFAGRVAGRNWVSLLVAPGVLVTLGPLLDAATTADRVRLRTPVGRVGPGHAPPPVGRGGSGREGATLHLSVRVDGVYVDPLAYLVDRPRPRLAPLLAPGGLPGD
jgi:murein DD-endopeptidase MepM/ murein hydrolase activator NlpD